MRCMHALNKDDVVAIERASSVAAQRSLRWPVI